MVSVLGSLVLFLLRRIAPAIVLGLGALLMVSFLSLSRLPSASSEGLHSVRVLLLNTRTTNPKIVEIMSLIEHSGASIVVLIEPNADLARGLRDDARIRAIYPTIRMPSRGDPYQVSLSVWPVQDPADGWQAFDRGRGVVFETEFGPLAFIQLHPHSPRTLTKWREGNQTVREALALAHGKFSGIPLLLGADLNSSPGGSRSRRLARSGFERAKPMWYASGTFPAWSFWPFQIAIDDVWASGEWSRRSWKTVSIPGSDHLGVSVELSLDISYRGADSP